MNENSFILSFCSSFYLFVLFKIFLAQVAPIGMYIHMYRYVIFSTARANTMTQPNTTQVAEFDLLFVVPDANFSTIVNTLAFVTYISTLVPFRWTASSDVRLNQQR